MTAQANTRVAAAVVRQPQERSVCAADFWARRTFATTHVRNRSGEVDLRLQQIESELVHVIRQQRPTLTNTNSPCGSQEEILGLIAGPLLPLPRLADGKDYSILKVDDVR